MPEKIIVMHYKQDPIMAIVRGHVSQEAFSEAFNEKLGDEGLQDCVQGYGIEIRRGVWQKCEQVHPRAKPITYIEW